MSQCKKCQADLTGAQIRTGVAKTTGKPWSALVCPSCKDLNFQRDKGYQGKSYSSPQSGSKPEAITGVLERIATALENINQTIANLGPAPWDKPKQDKGIPF